MKLTLPAVSCMVALTLSGCTSVPAPTNIYSYSDITDLAIELYRSAEETIFGASLEKAGLNPNSSTYKDEVKKQWWATSCPPVGEEQATVDDHKIKFAQYCQQKGGQYLDSGFCWRNGNPIFYASVVYGAITARTCGNGYPITYHIIEPTGNIEDFKNWFKDLSHHLSGGYGVVNVYKGKYVQNTYWWTDQKPRIFFSYGDTQRLDPVLTKTMEETAAKLAAEGRAAKLRNEQEKAQKKAILDAQNAKLIPQWRSYGIGTKVCREGTPIMGNRVQVTGFIEGFSDSKLQIRIVHIGGINWTVGGFKETVTWEYPSGWNLCE